MIFSSYYLVIEVTHRPHTLFTPLEPPLEGDGFLLSSNTPGDLFQALFFLMLFALTHFHSGTTSGAGTSWVTPF